MSDETKPNEKAESDQPTGGDLVADVLEARGVEEIFTLCGGHISPILVSSKKRGIDIVDVRDEVTAAFAADAVSRLTGRPGVAAVTAGPGVTNTITAVKNAQLAQSPMVLLGGATGTILEGRGSLQDIDQMALFEPHVKWQAGARTVKDLVPLLEEAFEETQVGVPGPVFLECPVDLLYAEPLVREIYGVDKEAGSLGQKALHLYLKWHLYRLFRGADRHRPSEPAKIPVARATGREVRRVASALAKAKKPVALVGSQATLRVEKIHRIADAVRAMDVPVYLSGMARGLLGADAEAQMRHKRSKALKEADLVLLFGVPCDFRLDYGRHIPKKAKFVSVNLSEEDLVKNRRPDVPILADPGTFLVALADELGEGERDAERREWFSHLSRRDDERDRQIAEQGEEETEFVNPIHLLREVEKILPDESILVADGGDFVATASYIVQPRGPLRWLDPGVFGTLGVGGGFALGAKRVHPESEVWLFWGDGSAAYSIAEFDTYVRHGLPVIAVVGNDGGWTQIAREQVEILGDDTATVLERNDYHEVAKGWGAEGLLIEKPEEVPQVLRDAQEIARSGKPVLVNAKIGKTDFRKGSISM